MALDQITKAFVDEFLTSAGLPSLDEPTDFERFVTHVVLSPLTDTPIDYPNVMAGAGGDTGLDSIAILVNGELITDVDDLDSLTEAGTTLDVHYILIQTETATSFNTAKIGQIGFGAKDFFSAAPTLARNSIVENAAEISTRILKNARLFRNTNPTCSIFYATAGRWVGDQNLEARISAEQGDLTDLNLFSEVKFIPLDARAIQKRFQSLATGAVREISFPSRTTLPDIEGVSESHLGFVTAADLLDLLSDEDGSLMSAIFYENVRDFQGESNKVNAEIAATLSGPQQTQFPLMNNGVTIIAKSVRQTGNRFLIQGFQVVNGCQTCNVLWLNREKLDNSVLVPLRLISTDNDDIILDIIRATNRQTEVKEEQFFATADYLKQLEQHFESAKPERRLYLERRLRQYAQSPIEKTRVIPFNSLVRAFASLILAEPHRATRNYRQVLERIPDDILNPSHQPAVYMAAATALYRLDFLFRNGVLDRRFSPAKYHLLLAGRLLASPIVPKELSSRAARDWANKLTDRFWDVAAAEKTFLEVSTIVDKLADGELTRDKIRTQQFTEKLLDYFGLRGS